ncbi:MAG: PAS domain S-box protein [Syntrophothermus sp.]
MSVNTTGLVFVNSGFKISEASSSAGDFLGVNSTALINQFLDSYIHPDFVSKFQKAFKSIHIAKEQSFKAVLTTEAGHNFAAHVTIMKLPFNNLVSEAFCISFVSMEADQEQNGLRIAAGDDEYKRTFENMPIGTYKTTSGGKILMANPALISMLGYISFEELASRNLEKEGYENQSYTRENFKKLIREKGEIKGFESTWRRKDGRLIYVRENARLVGHEGEEEIYEGTVEDITKKKLSENRLKESEKRFRALIQNSSDVILLLDIRGTILFASPSLTRIGGYQTDEVVGHKVFGFIHPEDQINSKSFFTKLLRTYNKPFTTELRARHKDGRWLWKEATATNLLNDSGINGIIVNFRNITERKEFEIKLKKSEEEYRELADALPQIIIVMNEAGELSYFNQKWKDYTGLEASRILSARDITLIHREDRKKTLEIWNKTRSSSGHLNVLLRFLRKDGEFRWHLAEGIRKKSDNANIPNWIFTLTDIHEQKVMQEKLENTLHNLSESERKLLEAQTIAHVGSYDLDLRTGKFKWTREIYNIFELNAAANPPDMYEIVHYVHPDDRSIYVSTVRSAFKAFKDFEIEVRLMLPGQKLKYIYYMCRPAADDAGELTRRAGAIMDITERKLQQQNLEKALRELERSNNDLERFAYLASHDLQEPLRMISSYMKVLEQKYGSKLDSKANEYMHYAIDGSKRMASLIKDLLLYSRVTSHAMEFEEVDLNNLLKDVMEDLQLVIHEKKAIVVSSVLPVVKGDATQLRQLLQNLLVNAIKFQGENPPEIIINAENNGPEWIISVKDNGIGIASEYHLRIFEIFQRLHEQGRYPGTGIGLALCKKIIERHGGKIWVESESGKGTIFYFTLPADYNSENS